VRIGFKTSQTDVEWSVLLDMWEFADQELPVFDSGWLFDHFVSLSTDRGGSYEAWTTLAALAARTRRLQLGHLVLGNTYRHPVLTAKMGATLDHISAGRFVLGLGAGWHETEHAMYGWRLPRIGERISMLDAAVRVVQGMWKSPASFSFDGAGYERTDARCEPAPRTPGGPPIWLGTQGVRRGLRILAERAQGWNSTRDLTAFRTKRDALLRHCEAVGRDPAEIEISTQVAVDGDIGMPDLLTAAKDFVEAGVDHLIIRLPAAHGADGLRQLAHEVAEPLRERFD
jgi:alkanesulfonate monooxygenase SsuD/methylene tetrahydromethanopterin reductase-like flavin-dependent oxidoreductase (luciferase family)